MSKPTLASFIASSLLAVGVQAEDGGLIRYAERIARRGEGERALPMHHLAPLAEGYERAEKAILVRDASKARPVFECHHAPVQHGKTTLIQRAILRILRRNPRAWIAYCAYNEATAVAKMYEVRQLCEMEGIRIDPNFDTGVEFRTREGGGVVCGGIVGGPWTSRGFDLIIIDDPYKTAQDAYSVAWRTAVENAFWTALWTRRRPWTSIIVNAARWHPADLIGALVKRGWRYVRLTAIDDNGCRACATTRQGGGRIDAEEHTCSALWPERWPIAELLAIRDGRPANDTATAIDPVPLMVWASLYQGSPVSEGGRIFDPAALVTYSALPEGAYVEVMGVDVAYGAEDRHDCSAIVVWRRYTAEPRVLYLAECWIGHEPVELFACRCAEVQYRRGGGVTGLNLPRTTTEIEMVWRPQLQKMAGVRQISAMWYGSTTEQGTAGLMAGYGARVRYARAAVDKLARAQAGGYTSTWGEGRVRWPVKGTEHVDRLRVQHELFTGAPGDADDGVDAGVAGHDIAGIPAPRSLGGDSGRALDAWQFSSREG